MEINSEFLIIFGGFLSAIFAFDHLYHVKMKSMMKALETINRVWDSKPMLIARKTIISHEKSDFSVIQKETVDFKLITQDIYPDEYNKVGLASSEAYVANFLEEIGFFLERGVVDIDFIYQMYGDAEREYYKNLEEHLDESRRLSSDSYSKFRKMHTSLEDFKKKRCASMPC